MTHCFVTVAGCPTSVFVTTSARSYTAGSVLTCTSDGHSAPTHYSWTDPASGEVVAGGRDVTLDGPLFSLTCTATAEFSGAVGPCSAALTVGNSQPSTTSTSTDSDTRTQRYSLRATCGRRYKIEKLRFSAYGPLIINPPPSVSK